MNELNTIETMTKEFKLLQMKLRKSLRISDAKEDLSTYQKYLLDIYNVVRDGNCSSDILNRNPGMMVQSRWLTTANRILRTYISTEKPSFT